MMGRKIVQILLYPQAEGRRNYDEYKDPLRYFILNLNKIQGVYEFDFLDEPDEESAFSETFSEAEYDATALFARFSQEVRPQIQPMFRSNRRPEYWVNIISARLTSNYFWVTEENVLFITTDVWEKEYSPPSMFEYLVHSIFGGLLEMNHIPELGSHNELRGCIRDHTGYKPLRRFDIGVGYICDECEGAITGTFGASAYSEICNILERKWLGDTKTSGTVAYNLMHLFRFNIFKDSGFNKTEREKFGDFISNTFSQVSIQVIGAIIGAALIGYLIGYLHF